MKSLTTEQIRIYQHVKTALVKGEKVSKSLSGTAEYVYWEKEREIEKKEVKEFFRNVK